MARVISFQVIIHYALLTGDVGVKMYTYECRMGASGTNEAIVRAMKKVCLQEAPLLSVSPNTHIYWECAEWKTIYEKNFARVDLSLLNTKGLSAVINN